MIKGLENDGFEIHNAVIGIKQITALRDEVNRVVDAAGSHCVRHLCSQSTMIQQLASSQQLLNLLPEQMHLVRSILFDKTAAANWPVAWHQDLTIAVKEQHELEGYGPWSTKDGFPHVQAPVNLLKNMVSIRIHLDATLKTNGALRVLPGSHLYGKMDSNRISEFTIDAASDESVCECLAGDFLLMKPLILHASSRSEQPSRRRVIHLEYARYQDLDSALQWAEGFPFDEHNN